MSNLRNPVLPQPGLDPGRDRDMARSDAVDSGIAEKNAWFTERSASLTTPVQHRIARNQADPITRSA